MTLGRLSKFIWFCGGGGATLQDAEVAAKAEPVRVWNCLRKIFKKEEISVSYDDELNVWANKVDPTLPKVCPNCNHTLNQIRYVHLCDRTTNYLTGAVNDHHYYVANCPNCNEELARQGAGTKFHR